jgi:toxin ParE1/3/4
MQAISIDDRLSLNPGCEIALGSNTHVNTKAMGKAQSQKYFAQLRKTIRMLSDNHALGKRQQDVGLNVLSFPYSSHVIYYVVSSSSW